MGSNAQGRIEEHPSSQGGALKGQGLARFEIETDIDSAQGKLMLNNLCVDSLIQKTRHVVEYGGKVWEIDVFEGVNAGLIVAEIELTTEDESFVLPDWIGPEVTNDSRYSNSSLTEVPFSEWGVSYSALLTGETGP